MIKFLDIMNESGLAGSVCPGKLLYSDYLDYYSPLGPIQLEVNGSLVDR